MMAVREISDVLGRLQRLRLGNGLDVLLLPQNHAPVVSFQTWFRTGSAHEEPGKTGLAHFFEHLSYKGTERIGPGEYDRLIEEQGGDAGASTWFDWTEYHVDIPASALDLVIDLESDRMQNLVLNEKIVADEKLVVLSERRDVIEDDPIGKANELLWHTALANHPYAHPTIGWQEDIESYTLADCRAFYAKHYVPNNAVIVVVGDFDSTHVANRLEQRYGAIGHGRVAPAARERKDFVPGGEDTVSLSVVTPKTLIAFGAPGYQNKDHVALSLTATILGSGASSRFTRSLAYEQELLYDFSLDTYPLKLSSLVEATLEGHDAVPIERAEEEFWALLKKFCEQGPTEGELTRAKNRLLLSRWAEIETNAGLAEEVGFAAVVSGEPDFFLRRTRWLQECTAQEVQAACRRYLTPNTATILRVEVL